MLVAGFIILTLVIAALLIAGAFSVSMVVIAEPSKRNAFRLRFVLILACWLVYVGALSSSGILLVPGFPPRFPLLLVMPAFMFISFFFVSGKFKHIIAATPAKWLVYIQSFRIFVELLLFKAFLENLVPREATFEGYNFDIIIGISALIVPSLAFRNGKTNMPVLRFYNLAGFTTLAIVIFVFVTQYYFPAVWHKQPSNAPIGVGGFPFAFLPGFLMPVAVFIHVFSLVKIKSGSNN